MTYYIGIDPGVSGAVALISDKTDPEPDLVYDTPVMVVAGATRNRSVMIPRQCSMIISHAIEDHSVACCVIEQVTAMIAPQRAKNGKSNAGFSSVTNFRLGHSLGVWEGILGALGMPVVQVRAQNWKKEFGLGSDKRQSVVTATELFPWLAGSLQRAKDHGRAEAILLAEYGRRVTMGKRG